MKYVDKVMSEKTVINEGTLASKIKGILSDEETKTKYKIPESRIKIINDIIEEFDVSKKDIQKLADKMATFLTSGKKNGRFYAAMNKLSEINPEIIEILNKKSEKLQNIISDGRTSDNSVKKFVVEFIAELAKFSDEELKTAVKAENEIANALRSM